MIKYKLIKNAKKIDNYLLGFLKKQKKSLLLVPMKYGVISGGKKIRSKIIMDTGKIFNIDEKKLISLCAAVECIHSYSLIHDDLPCMDNDSFRRGKLSTHKKFNEAQAILSGNGLLTLAFELLSKKYDSKISHEISKVSGAYGLAGGQSIDISLESKKLSLNKVLHIHELKTAKLFEFCVSAPFIDLDETNKANIARKYGNLLGRSFQIVDDIIDQDQDEDNKNILNYMSKRDALVLCNEYKVKADKYLNKLFPKKDNKLPEIFNYIIEQADT